MFFCKGGKEHPFFLSSAAQSVPSGPFHGNFSLLTVMALQKKSCPPEGRQLTETISLDGIPADDTPYEGVRGIDGIGVAQGNPDRFGLWRDFHAIFSSA